MAAAVRLALPVVCTCTGLGAIHSLYDGCLLSMQINVFTRDSQAPSMRLRQGWPLSTTLFGLLLDSLHHYLETAVPMAGIQILQIRLWELVVADNICLLASLPEQLQALIDALAACCAALQMEASVPKPKVMMVWLHRLRPSPGTMWVRP